QEQEAKETARDTRSDAVKGAERELQQARDDMANAQRSHAAIALAQSLHVGEDCPVCLQPVTALPHHPAPADLTRTKDAAEEADASLADEERQARARLATTRGSVVQLGAPPIEGADLAAAWETLTSWAQAQHTECAKRQPDLDAAAADLQGRVASEERALL